MVNKLSELAEFLEGESVPLWVKEALRADGDKILNELENHKSYTLNGPDGQKVIIHPKEIAA